MVFEINEALYKRVKGLIKAFLGAGGYGVQSVDDIAQECMIVIYKHKHTIRNAASARPWVFKLVRNKVVDVLRANRTDKESRIHFTLGEDREVISIDELAATNHNYDRPLVEESILEDICQIKNLDFANALYEYAFNELTYKQIANMQGVTINTIRSRISRARDAVTI